MTSRKRSERAEDKLVVRIGTKLFPDGTILEMVRTPNGELKLLTWNGKSTETAGQFVRDGETFVPLRIDPTILPPVQLPGNIAEYGSTRELFAEISGLISRATQEVPSVVQALTFFVFATWVIDFLPFAPCLWIVTPPTTTSAPLMQLLGLLCRRAVLVNEISANGLQSLAMDLKPTLLAEVFQATRRLLNLLRTSARRGGLIAATGNVLDASCAKIVFAPSPPRDPADAGFPLELVLSPMREYIPVMSPSEAERIAAEFQGKLLHYRLSNLTKVRAPSFDVSQFSAPMREVAYSLGACIVDDDELQEKVVGLLKPVDLEIRVRYTTLLPAIVLEDLLVRCHASTRKPVPVIEVTGGVNTVLVARGETLEVSPEHVGWMLRGLGLHTSFITGGRKGLILSEEVRERIHELAAGYGVRSLRAPSAKIECTFCAAMKARWTSEATSGSAAESSAKGANGRQA